MPTVPRASDNETSLGQSDITGMRPFPSESEWDRHPQSLTTWLPTGNAGFLLWITLNENYNEKEMRKQKAVSQDSYLLPLQPVASLS